MGLGKEHRKFKNFQLIELTYKPEGLKHTCVESNLTGLVIYLFRIHWY